MTKPIIEPITDQTLPEFAAFLEFNMPVSRSAEDWILGLRVSWCESRPNYGFLMRDQGEVVGGIGAFYADRIIGGQKEKFCNITSWCVLDSHRKYSMQLTMSIVAQRGYHFTDFSPTKVVAGTLQFFKFKSLDEGIAVVPNLPLPLFSGRVLTESCDIEQNLTGKMLDVWRDHTKFPWLHHLIVGKTNDWCYVIYKPRRFKSLPCSKVIYLSDGRVFNRYLNCLSWHFFWQGMMTTHVEKRMLSEIPMTAIVRTGFNPKQFLSQTLEPKDIDYLYSETVALDL
ncbi:MAG: hypothetical protein WAS49_03695 [Candidatus Dechloromonas phosphoritropha]|nr:hypothetical protein [Candidatus Dechloromonas phosphoritropha]MBP8788325.1 hypothetical protein [Azonexus sp.]MBP9228933.1 hypothetical protein [Azonexus sp.]